MTLQTHLRKMKTMFSDNGPVQYFLRTDEGNEWPMNPRIGNKLRINFSGTIHCISCQRKTNKSFQQGYCFPCFRSLAECDSCIVKPELCHFHKGTCRQPDWGQTHCMIPHVIYLANSSGLKVGITREHHKLTRWMDQGAIQALAIARVTKRLDAGMIESFLKAEVPDKTNWRTMLKGGIPKLDLKAAAEDILPLIPTTFSYEELADDTVEIEYPVQTYPEKVQSFNLDKNPLIEGILVGIKGQYLIFDSGVINLRNYAGYEVSID